MSYYAFFYKILSITKFVLLWLLAGFFVVLALFAQIDFPFSLSSAGFSLAAILLLPPSRTLVTRFVSIESWRLVLAVFLSAGIGMVILGRDISEQNNKLAQGMGFTSHYEYVEAKSKGFSDPNAFRRFSEAVAKKVKAEQRKAEAEAVIAEAKKAKFAMAAAEKAAEQAAKASEMERKAGKFDGANHALSKRTLASSQVVAETEAQYKPSDAQVCLAALITEFLWSETPTGGESPMGNLVYSQGNVYTFANGSNGLLSECTVEGKRIIWRMKTGRWRMSKWDSYLTYKVGDRLVTIDQRHPDGSTTVVSYSAGLLEKYASASTN